MATPRPLPRRRNLPRAQRLKDVVREGSRLFMEKGYEQTSVDELAAAVGVSVGSLYRWVTTKSDLLVLVCEDIYQGLPEQLNALAAEQEQPDEALRLVVRRYLESCVEHRRLILLLYREFRHLPEEAQLRSRAKEDAIVALLVRLMRRAQPDLTPRQARLLATDTILLGHLPALKGWQLRGSRTSLTSFVDQQTELVTSLTLAGSQGTTHSSS